MELLAITPLNLPPWAQGLLAAGVAILVAWIGYRGTRVKATTERDSVDVNASVEALRVLVDKQAERLKSLEERLSRIEDENRRLEDRNSGLMADLRTKDELIESFMLWLMAWETWDAEGRNGPAPSYTWQMRLYLERRNNNGAT